MNNSGLNQRSIAVLPFANFSGDQESEYFSDGMTEELIDRLVKVAGLRVAARTSCFAFKGRNADIAGIARQLRVGYVLEGSVRRAAGRLRVTAQLIDAETGFHLWSERYERIANDVFEIQDEIGAAIIAALQAQLGDEGDVGLPPLRRRPANLDAYDLYLQGRYLLARRSALAIRDGIERFQLAIACDPGYAAAHAGLAECYLVLASGTYGTMAPADALTRAISSAGRALTLNPSLAEAHVALGLAKLYGWDWAASETLLEGATRLDPGNANARHHYAWQLALTMSLDQAFAGIDSALELDPLSVPIRVARARVLQFMRRPADALAEIERVLDAEPDSAAALLCKGLVLIQSGRAIDALTTLRLAHETSATPGTAALIAYACGGAGQYIEGARLVEDIIARANSEYISPTIVAGAYVGLGKLDDAMIWYERAYEERSPGLIYLGVEPLLDPLRQDPRFVSLLRRIGLERSQVTRESTSVATPSSAPTVQGRQINLCARVQAAIGDGFLVEEELAGGGMSRIFLATERSLDRRVVVKVLPPELACEVNEVRFRQEARYAAHLQHPHILPVLAAETRGGLLYYMMPHVAGESLRHHLVRNRTLPLADATRILLEMADALAYAHERGVIHRDVKPENILLQGKHALLADFGIARAMLCAGGGRANRLTLTGTSIGTPGYMPPEQLLGEEIGPTADVYALAIVGYEMLAGDRPFTGSAQEVLAAHMTRTPRPLHEVRAEISIEVSAAIARALHKESSGRFATAAEFARALDLPAHA
ncbi:MAG TPA: protein kinase [Vicinamibacterales bacterium]|nr:protein kinase [Vicinamibacterales bacterium]